jgi:hypothetical protein
MKLVIGEPPSLGAIQLKVTAVVAELVLVTGKGCSGTKAAITYIMLLLAEVLTAL